jgi:hypothetical protein
MSHELQAIPPIIFAEAASLFRGERRFLAQWVDYFRNTTLAEVTQEAIERAIVDRLGNAAASTQIRRHNPDIGCTSRCGSPRPLRISPNKAAEAAQDKSLAMAIAGRGIAPYRRVL